MTNAGTAVLLALLLHLGGVDVDRAADARVISYRDSIPTAEWRLASHTAGTYLFVGEGAAGVLVVERVRGAGVVYTILHYDQPVHAPSSPQPPQPPELRRPVAIGTVSLDGVADALRRPRPGVSYAPDRDAIAVAWMASSGDPVDAETEGVSGDSSFAGESPSRIGVETASSSPDGETLDRGGPAGDPPGVGGLSVSVQASRLSASDPATSQVLILSLR